MTNALQRLNAKADKASGIRKRGRFNYVAVGGVTSTIHGAEIKKAYSALRDFSEVLTNLEYCGVYLNGDDNINNKYIRFVIDSDYQAALESMHAILDKLEFHLRDMQSAKGAQENHYLSQDKTLLENK